MKINIPIINYFNNHLQNVPSFINDYWLEFKEIPKIYVLQKTFINSFEKAGIKLITEELIENVDDCYNLTIFNKTTYVFKIENGLITLFGFYDNILTNFFSNIKWKEEIWGIDENNLPVLLITFQNFLKYVQIEEKILNPKKDNGKSLRSGEKILNNSPYDIIILNSTYFTNIIRSEGFKVSGHFRLQPTINGKKLIWINDFEKHGYKRNALKNQIK